MPTILIEAFTARLDQYNEELACHSKACAPPPIGEGGSNATGGRRTDKFASGVSAHPTDRKAPYTSFRTPITKEDLDDINEELGTKFKSAEDLLVDMYDTDLGNGFSSHVNFVEEVPLDTNRIRYQVSGVIEDSKGKHVGVFERHMYSDKEGRLVAEHDLLNLQDGAQGHGIADRFNAHAIAKYQDYGVDRMELHAAMTVGPYAWARQGFRVSNEGDRKAVIKEMVQSARKFKGTAAEKKALKALETASDAGEDVQPIHLASIGESPGQSTWFGKRAMLEGPSWYGTFYFDRTVPVTAAATSLEHAALRPAYGASTALTEAYAARLQTVAD